MPVYESLEEWFDGSTRVLDNGITVWAKGSPQAKQYAVYVGMRAGSVEDPLDRPGCAHCFEHIPFRGAGRYDTGLAMGAQLEEWAGHWNASTTFDRTIFEVTSNPQTRDHALDVIYAMVAEPHFSGVETERINILREYHTRQSYPETRAYDELSARAFGNRRWNHPIIGIPDSIMTMNADHLEQFYRAWYQPNHMIVAIVGPEETTALLDLVEQYFGRMISTAGTLSEFDSDPQPCTGTMQIEWERPEGLVWVRGFYPATLPNMIHVNMLNEMLGSGLSSPIFQELREREAFFYGSGSDLSICRGGIGSATFWAQIDPQRIDEFWPKFWRVVSRPAPDRLEWVRHHYFGNASRQPFQAADIASAALGALFDFGNVTPRNDVLGMVLKTSHEDIEKLVLENFAQNQSFQASYRPASV